MMEAPEESVTEKVKADGGVRDLSRTSSQW